MKAYFQTLVLAICLVPALAFASFQPASLFNELAREGVLKVELELSLATMESHVKSEEEQDAVFRFTDKQGRIQEWEAEVSVRGRFRRRICEFPPLKIDFSKKDLANRGFLPFDDLKIVTHCQEGEEGEEAVLREYLAYQLYGMLTNYNYRAQLVEITYIDTDSHTRLARYGIILEDTDELAARLNSEECESCFGMDASLINSEIYRTHALFQYMIGNADWSLAVARNLKIMKPTDGGAYWITPYDFDFSGLVDADYAIPNSDVGQAYIGQRVYMGAGVSRQGLEEAIRHFRSQREEITRYVESFTLLSKKSRKEIIRYLGRFYDSLGEESFIQAASSM